MYIYIYIYICTIIHTKKPYLRQLNDVQVLYLTQGEQLFSLRGNERSCWINITRNYILHFYIVQKVSFSIFSCDHLNFSRLSEVSNKCHKEVHVPQLFTHKRFACIVTCIHVHESPWTFLTQTVSSRTHCRYSSAV